MAKSERKQAQEHDVASEKLAAMFKALGDPTRLRIFEFLRANSGGPIELSKKGDVRLLSERNEGDSDTGITVGEVGFHVTGGSKDPSTISHHLKELRQAALISMERQGKRMICALHPDALSVLRDFCCTEPNTQPEQAVVEKAPTRRPRRVKDTEIDGMTELSALSAPLSETSMESGARVVQETVPGAVSVDTTPARKKKKKE
ncbi:MAG: metalloregulator ArsR/SmtB family transcription factor [bacterium]|jgi:ArsR family transcriptional regulator